MDSKRQICISILVPADVESVWQAWTTEDGVRSFFAPAASIDLRINGRYDIFFNPAGLPGERGAENQFILALEKPFFFSFTWNAPPSMPLVRSQHTTVSIYLESQGPKRTLVTVVHNGWGQGEHWDEAFEYFEYAWGSVVLPQLVRRFQSGPIQWA
jgi:uncharacterized protein YndB with AHSA1/START domain